MGYLSSMKGFGSSGGKLNQQEFLTSGTWVRPAGVNIIYVTAVGGGGGASYWTGTRAGGGGGIIYKYPMVVFGNITVTIGGGGAGLYDQFGTASNGGNTTVGSYTAYGGGGGSYYYSTEGTNGETNLSASYIVEPGTSNYRRNNQIFGSFAPRGNDGKLIDKINGNYVLVSRNNVVPVANCGNGGTGSAYPNGSSGYAMIEWFT